MGAEVSRGGKTKRAARLARGSLATGAEAESASVCAHGVGSRVGIGYVIGFGYPRGRDGRSARAVASLRLLGRATTLGHAFDFAGGFTQRLVLAQPPVFELGLRVSVTVGLRRVALTSPARADLLSFPAPARKRRVRIVVDCHSLLGIG